MRLFGALCILPLLAVSQILQLSSVPLKTDESILSLTSPSLLQDILVPRPVGSKALASAQDAFESRFKALGWHLERDEFEDDTPVGRKPFRNIIFTSDPSKPRTVVLAAHIDSKPEPEGFVGAIDSAAPCAILMDVANSLAPWLKTQQAKSDTSITIVLFDGEEAFKRWTATDSIYGARHLAKEWSKPLSAPGTASAQLRNSSRLATIDVFILLDLLGSPNPSIRSFYQNTHWLFERFQQAQSRLGEASLIQGQGDFFSQGAYGGHIEDDHLPFLRAGIPILHMIPAPFPSVWHKMSDDITALDQDTVNTWSMLTQLVVAEMLADSPRVRDELVSEYCRRLRV